MTESVTPSRMGRIVLVLSLVLNLLLIGLIVGAVGSGRAGPQRGFDPGLGQLGQILPREDRAEVGRDIRRALRDAGHTPRELMGAMRDAIALLEEDTFDADAFIATVEAQQDWQDTVRVTALNSFVDHISDMSVDERRAVAAALRDRLRKGPGRPRGEGDRDQRN